MELMQALYTRRSVRRYLPTLVDKATIEALIEAAIQAPSASNSQPWAFGVLLGVDRLREYSTRSKAAFLTQTAGNPAVANLRARLADPALNIFHDAPGLICIYARTSGAHARTDCALAAQNLMLAAHALGLATCWIGLAQALFDSGELKRELGVPADYVSVGEIVIGYPDGELPPARPRKAPEVLFWE